MGEAQEEQKTQPETQEEQETQAQTQEGQKTQAQTQEAQKTQAQTQVKAPRWQKTRWQETEGIGVPILGQCQETIRTAIGVPILGPLRALRQVRNGGVPNGHVRRRNRVPTPCGLLRDLRWKRGRRV